ncbi:hypothetical protein [Wenyingzhuangia fucanilytica]|uniref:hypothetical protein n=1 Tax=Wenyingzhuangia fucanilytica TaxID=1790137 RepID=UPI0012FA6E3A|nr:hypothetical protein [Wenyingzhuangia fucanilytica]
MGEFTAFGIVIFIAIIVFLIFRDLMLWYWKVPKILKNQEKTNELLQQILDKEKSL